MVRLVTSLLSIFLVSLLTDPAVGQDRLSNHRVFTVSAFVYENGDLLGTPTFTVREGAPGSIAMHNSLPYALEVRIETPNPDQLAQFGDPEGEHLSASARVFVPHEIVDEWRLTAAPQLLVQERRQASVEVDTSGQNYRRQGATGYTDQIRVDLSVTEVNETWFDQGGVEKSVRTCAIESLPGPKTLAASAALAVSQSGGMPTIGDGDCCSNGCLTCCGTGPTCCADPANCASGCCVP